MDNERAQELKYKRHINYAEYKEYYGITTNRSVIGEVFHLTDVLRSESKDRNRAADLLEIVLSGEGQ